MAEQQGSGPMASGWTCPHWSRGYGKQPARSVGHGTPHAVRIIHRSRQRQRKKRESAALGTLHERLVLRPQMSSRALRGESYERIAAGVEAAERQRKI